MMAFLSNSALWHWTSPVWLVIVPLVIARVWFRPAKLSGRLLWFLAAGAVLAFSFVSPIGVLADGYLFSAHMIQHLLLLLIVPLCLLLSFEPGSMDSMLEKPWALKARQYLAHPLMGWMAGLGAMWIWHVPSLCNAATESPWLGLVRSATFLLAGLAFWWPIYSPVTRFRLDPLLGVIYLFSACLGCTLLGIYITFTTITVCPAFANPSDRIGILSALYDAGLTPTTDQQLGGLLMWVPPCSLYVCAILSVLCRWYTAEATQPGETIHPKPNVPEASA